MVKMGTVWDRTAEFLTDNLGAVLPIALFAFFVPASIEGGVADLRENGTDGLKLILMLMQVAFAILSLWGSLAITAMALDPGTAADAGQVATRRLLPGLLVNVALLAGIFVLFAPVAVILVAGGVDMAALGRNEVPDVPPAAAGSVALYLIVLAAALLWLGARLALVTPVIVGEKRAFDAVPRSWRLTQGVTLKIIGVVLLYALVAMVAILATQTVFGILFGLIAGQSDGISIAGVLTSIMVAAVQTGFTLLGPAFAAKLYLALVSAREPAPAT